MNLDIPSVNFSIFPRVLLFTQIKRFDNSSVSFNVYVLEVIKKTTTLTYQSQKRSLGIVILLVGFHVVGKVIDTVGK